MDSTGRKLPTERLRKRLQLMVSGVALTAGAGACLYLVQTKPVPVRNDAFARVLEVEVATLESRDTRIGVVGFGTVRPRKQIEVIPLVSGKLIQAHQDLARGKVIPKSALLYKLDPTVFESRVRKVEAESKRHEAALNRLDAEAAMLRERISNAGAMLSIHEREYRTTKQLYEVEHVGTQHDLDVAQLEYLRQKDNQTALQARLAMIPHQKLDVEAQLDEANARLEQARYNLDATEIKCPFDARVEAVHARESQVVMAHLSIATLTDMSAFELSVGIDPSDLRWLDPAVRPGALEGADPAQSPEVEVRWSLHGQRFTWKGRVTRFERVDEKTGTAQMVVEVLHADMIARTDFGSEDAAPHLAIGMFCRAELPGRRLTGALLVPRHAIYDNQWVYALTPDADFSTTGAGHLIKRRISPLRSVGDDVLVDYEGRAGTEPCDLKRGDRVVLSRMAKPVAGMRVKLRETSVGAPLEGVATRGAGAFRGTARFAASLTLGGFPRPTGVR